MTCLCGHSDSAHDPAGRCHAFGCLCESFVPVPQIGERHPMGAGPIPQGLAAVIASAD
jgi:hypothetical protein